MSLVWPVHWALLVSCCVCLKMLAQHVINATLQQVSMALLITCNPVFYRSQQHKIPIQLTVLGCRYVKTHVITTAKATYMTVC